MQAPSACDTGRCSASVIRRSVAEFAVLSLADMGDRVVVTAARRDLPLTSVGFTEFDAYSWPLAAAIR